MKYLHCLTPLKPFFWDSDETSLKISDADAFTLAIVKECTIVVSAMDVFHPSPFLILHTSIFAWTDNPILTRWWQS